MARLAVPKSTKSKTKVVPSAQQKRAAPAPIERKLSGLSLAQLLKATPPYVRNNAAEVVVLAVEPAKTRGNLPALKAKLSAGTNKKKRLYRASVIGKEEGIPIHKQKHVLVDCSCDFFLYYCEVALHKWGSARIKHSNGQHPGTTNPGLHPMCCKHLYKLAETIKKHKL